MTWRGLPGWGDGNIITLCVFFFVSSRKHCLLIVHQSADYLLPLFILFNHLHRFLAVLPLVLCPLNSYLLSQVFLIFLERTQIVYSNLSLRRGSASGVIPATLHRVSLCSPSTPMRRIAITFKALPGPRGEIKKPDRELALPYRPTGALIKEIGQRLLRQPK